MYEGAKTSVKTSRGNTDELSIDIGLHQQLVVSPFLFTIVIDELTKGIRDTMIYGFCR